MKRISAGFLAAALALQGCATLKVTVEQRPREGGRAVPARLGIHDPGEQLKRILADADRRRTGLAAGQLFSDVELLPDEARFSAPQDLFEQFGTDLILQAHVADLKTQGGLNSYFASCLLLMWACVAVAPQMTLEMDVTLAGSLREARTGRLLWAGSLTTRASNHFAPVKPEKAMAALTELALRNAWVGLLETAAAQAAGYAPPPPGEAASRQAPVQPVKKSAPRLRAAAKAKNRYAIVIGIERYRERLPKAEFAARDAEEVARFLTQYAGYPEENVIVRLNDQATKSDLEKFFESWVKNNLDASSSLFIYYSGHGAPNPETGDSYLVPYDGDPAYIAQTGYSLKRLYQALDSLPTREVVVALDACFSGAGGRSVLMAGAKPLVVLKPANPAGKTIVMSATSGNHISVAYQEAGEGLFTHYLLQALSGEADSDGDHAVDVREAFAYLKPQVQRVARRQYNTEQVPQLIEPLERINQPTVKLIAAQ